MTTDDLKDALDPGALERCHFYARDPHSCADHGTLYTPALCGKAAVNLQARLTETTDEMHRLQEIVATEVFGQWKTRAETAEARLTDLSAENERLTEELALQQNGFKHICSAETLLDAAQSRITRIEEAARDVVSWAMTGRWSGSTALVPGFKSEFDMCIWYLAAALDTPSTPPSAEK